MSAQAEPSFDDFYVSELGKQVRRAHLLLGSNAAANDVVHDSFVEIYRRWGDIEEPGPYLQRTVTNRCRTVHRRRSSFKRNAHRLIAENRASVDSIDESLEDVLATLPFNHRAAIVLRFYFGLTTDQIADELDCAPGSVGPWIDRGLTKMRKALT